MSGTYVAPDADDEALLNVDFDLAGGIHDWRNYVGENTRRLWRTFTSEQRRALAEDADVRAGYEDWD